MNKQILEAINYFKGEANQQDWEDCSHNQKSINIALVDSREDLFNAYRFAEREQKAKALYALHVNCFNSETVDMVGWGSAGNSTKESYRKMIDAGVELPL